MCKKGQPASWGWSQGSALQSAPSRFSLITIRAPLVFCAQVKQAPGAMLPLGARPLPAAGHGGM